MVLDQNVHKGTQFTQLYCKVPLFVVDENVKNCCRMFCINVAEQIYVAFISLVFFHLPVDDSG